MALSLKGANRFFARILRTPSMTLCGVAPFCRARPSMVATAAGVKCFPMGTVRGEGGKVCRAETGGGGRRRRPGAKMTRCRRGGVRGEPGSEPSVLLHWGNGALRVRTK